MNEQLALFPLGSFLLPRGKMKLRVFEPRYVRLVKEAVSGKRPFAMATLNPLVSQQHPDRILPLVCKVSVDDFETLPDGLLGITISGISRQRIIRRWQEDDKLHVAEVAPETDWHSVELSTELNQLSAAFAELLDEYPQLAALYPQPQLTDGAWLAGRWLELLPMQPALKLKLATQDPQSCLQQLQHWLAHNA